MGNIITPPGAQGQVMVPMNHQHIGFEVSDFGLVAGSSSGGGLQLISVGGATNVEIIARTVSPAMLHFCREKDEKAALHQAADMAVEYAYILKEKISERTLAETGAQPEVAKNTGNGP